MVLKNINMNLPQIYTCSPSWTLLPPRTIPLGHPSAPAPSIHYCASNLDWWFVSYMILYMFQCHSPKSSHPLPPPQNPKDCSIHQCLFFCLVYRVIVTIFLNSTYMCWYTVLVFFFMAYFTLACRISGVCHSEQCEMTTHFNCNFHFHNNEWCCESGALNMLANLENSAVAKGLENVSFPSNPKEKQWLRMLKSPHIHLTR